MVEEEGPDSKGRACRHGQGQGAVFFPTVVERPSEGRHVYASLEAAMMLRNNKPWAGDAEIRRRKTAAKEWSGRVNIINGNGQGVDGPQSSRAQNGGIGGLSVLDRGSLEGSVGGAAASQPTSTTSWPFTKQTPRLFARSPGPRTRGRAVSSPLSPFRCSLLRH